MEKIMKDTIHANGIDIAIYTKDFENEFISLTDIGRYKSSENHKCRIQGGFFEFV